MPFGVSVFRPLADRLTLCATRLHVLRSEDWELDYEVCHLVASARRRKIPVTHITRHPEGRFLPVEALH